MSGKTKPTLANGTYLAFNVRKDEDFWITMLVYNEPIAGCERKRWKGAWGVCNKKC